MLVSKIDRAAQSAAPETIELIEGIAEWTLSLQGKTPLLTGLAHLRDAFGAESVVLTRLARIHGSPSQVLASDKRSGESGVDLITCSFASRLLGPYLFKPRSGSTWYSDQTDIHDDPIMSRLRRQRGISDMVIFVLEVEDKAIFFLEMHFEHRLCAQSRGVLNCLGVTLMSIWSRRATGRFAEAQLKGRPSSAADDTGRGLPVDIISVANPAGLSRAEFRVCTVLSTGLSAARARKELGICESTLRSHLRQIYIKTGCKNMSELLFALLAPELPASHSISPVALRSIS